MKLFAAAAFLFGSFTLLPFAISRAESPARENMEKSLHLWALIRAEARDNSPTPGSPRPRGRFRDLNIRGLRAQRLRLSGFDFGNSDLRGADFTGCDFESVNFEGADLRGAVLTSVKFGRVTFDEKTQLPFSKERALQLGWTEVKK